MTVIRAPVVPRREPRSSRESNWHKILWPHKSPTPGTMGQAKPFTALRDLHKIVMARDCGPRHRSTRRSRFGLERCDPCLQALVFGARLGGHCLDRLELLARHEVHVCDEPFQPLFDECVDLVAHAFRGARGIGEDSGHAVEERIVGLCHGALLMTLYMASRRRRGKARA